MKITFFGAARCVTGSCFLLEHENKKFLVDCGMFQGEGALKNSNSDPFKFNVRNIDYVFITHAHIDHTGLLPKLYKEGFRGTVYSTPGTKELMRVMLKDSANVQRMKAHDKFRQRLGKEPFIPIYNNADVAGVVSLMRTSNYNSTLDLGPIKVTFYDAGHVLGSSHVEIKYNVKGKEKIALFSGDIGQEKNPILNRPTHVNNADYVITESTYGARNHKEASKKKEMLAKVINETYDAGGRVIIPSFSLERSQELLFYIRELENENKIPKLKVFLDSPLAIKITKIYGKYIDSLNNEVKKIIKRNKSPFVFKNLNMTSDRKSSQRINSLKEPCIILAGSGMCTGGRVLHHLKHSIWDNRNTVLFVGYQAEGTLGREILEGAEQVNFMNQDFVVRAKIKEIQGFSGHASQKELIAWIKDTDCINTPKDGVCERKPSSTVFVIHGEEEQMEVFANKIASAKRKVIIPKIGETHSMD